MLLDCGLMFPEADMPGIDLVLPDFTYLRENADRIDGCVATHGHEDHVGGLSFLLREVSFPIYGSPLTLGLARSRIEEAGLLGRTELVPVRDGERRVIGPFDLEFIPVTHSVPHAFATALHTPQGVILHSGDFKLDLTPVDGRCTDLARIGAIAVDRGRPAAAVRLDQRRGARPRAVASARSAACSINLFRQHEGRRIITACFASHIHRIQQIADAAIACGTGRRDARTVDAQERAPRPRPRIAAHSRRPPVDIEDDRRPSARQGVRHLDRVTGRAHVGAGAAWPRARTVGSRSPARTRSS